MGRSLPEKVGLMLAVPCMFYRLKYVYPPALAPRPGHLNFRMRWLLLRRLVRRAELEFAEYAVLVWRWHTNITS